MMRVKVKTLRAGLHPSEVVVVVNTSSGEERLVVDKGSLSGDFIDVGYPIDQSAQLFLVELPQETTSGSWRVWVPKDNVVPA